MDDMKEYILSHFHYDNGVITRDDRKGGLGSLDKYGYKIIKVKGKQFKAHRIAWLLCKGDFPKTELDHINRNKLDNRIENLREADSFIQNRNKVFSPNPKTGKVGIHYDTATKGLKKRFTTRINNKAYRFYTLEDAVKFREENGLWV